MEKPTGQSGAERRRSQRIFLSIPVLVEGNLKDGQWFCEETKTLVVNAHGALITLGAAVEVGQKLALKNRKSKEGQACRVVHLGTALMEKTQVAVEFAQPAPEFWHIAFPPEDWTTSSVETPKRVTK